MKLNGMVAFARNGLENQPGVGGNQQGGEPWRGKGFANILGCWNNEMGGSSPSWLDQVPIFH